MSPDTRKLTALLAFCTSTALVVAACGDDGGGSGTGSGGAGSGTGATASGSTGTGVDPCDELPVGCFDAAACFATPPTGVSLRNDLLPIMERSCTLSTACHSNPASPTTNEGYKPYLGNKKSEGESDVPAILEAIVDVESTGDPSKVVVAPGDWKNSYFMNKLDGALESCADISCDPLDGCGRLMPQGAPKPLPLAERNLFRAWIAEGAQDN